MIINRKTNPLFLGFLIILSILFVSACGDGDNVVSTKKRTDKPIATEEKLAKVQIPIKQDEVAATATHQNKQTVQDCLTIRSSLKRLNCFDQYFKTPLESTASHKLKGMDANHWEQSGDKRVRFLASHLKKHQAHKSTDLSYYAYDADKQNTTSENATGRLLISVAAHSARLNDKIVTERLPVLIFQCYQDISSIQLLWPNNLHQDKIDLRIWNENRLLLDSTWRVIDEEFLVTSPRGLPGVTIIKRLLDYQQLTFESRTDGAHFKASFHVKQLKQKIIPLGKACHWL